MKVKQISVFIENKAGRLADVTQQLADRNIDISALSIADTTHYGILRLIVNKPDEAESALKEAGMTVSSVNVVAIAIDDEPGALCKVLQILKKCNIEVEYIYAFVGKVKGRALVILKVGNIEEAENTLSSEGISTLTADEVYTL